MSMIRRLFVLNVTYVTIFAGAVAPQGTEQLRVTSPDGRNEVTVQVREGRLYYQVQHAGRLVITPSLLGFEFRGAPRLRDSLLVGELSRRTADGTWTQPWGEVAQ